MRSVRVNVVVLLLACIAVAQRPAPAARASAAMVTIRGTAEDGSAVSGSGFLVAPNGTIVTSLRLVKGLTHPEITISTGDIFDAFTLVNSDARRDLAIIRIAGFDLPSIELGNSNSVQPGDAILLVSGAKGQVETGSVRGITTSDGSRVIELSGGANVLAGELLLDAKGQAIGILSAAARSNAKAIPINYARGLLEAPMVASKPTAPAVTALPLAAAAPQTAQAPEPSSTPTPEAARTVTAATPALVATPAAPTKTAAAAPPREVVSPTPVQMAEATHPPVQPAPVAQPAPAPAVHESPEFARRAAVRKIYIESLGQGEGPDMLRDKIAHNLKELNFLIVDSPSEADAILSGSGKWDHVRVQHFRARLVAGDARELWSGEVSTGGWIRSASSSVATKLVENITRVLALPTEK